MLREHRIVLSRIHKTWDILLTVAAFLFAYFVKKYYLPDEYVGLSTAPNYYILLLLCIMSGYLLFELAGLYKPYRHQSFRQVVAHILRAVLLSACCLSFLLFVFRIGGISRIFIGLFLCFNFFLLVLSKWFIYNTLANLRRRGFNSRNILVVGCNRRIDEVLKAIALSPESGYRVLGCLATDETEIGCPATDRIRVLGGIDDFSDILNSYVIDELIFADPLRKIKDAGKYIYNAELRGISVHILPDWGIGQINFRPNIGSFRFRSIAGMPTMTLIATPHTNPVMLIKYAVDFLVAGVGLTVCAIPFLLIAVAIKCASRGPVFFKQERIGLNGRKFEIYKFRTMVVDAEQRKRELLERNESDGPAFKIRNDPRIIPYVGTFLRKTSLDELPQLINILKGEMSLVGPRPPLAEEVDIYDIWQRRRLSMKPGLTCIWQIYPKRNEVRFNDWVNMDLKYIDNWSLGLDFKVLCKTAVVMLMGHGR